MEEGRMSEDSIRQQELQAIMKEYLDSRSIMDAKIDGVFVGKD